MLNISIDDLAREAKSTDRAKFAARHPEPLLVLDSLATDEAAEGFSTTSGGRKWPLARLRLGLPTHGTPVVPLKKRAGANEFSNMITLGRAGNNDLALEVGSISKFHAYFTRDARDGRWYLHDAGSANGTWVNGDRLGDSHSKTQIEDGAAIQIGPDARMRFFKPEALYDLLTTAPPPGARDEQ